MEGRIELEVCNIVGKMLDLCVSFLIFKIMTVVFCLFYTTFVSVKLNNKCWCALESIMHCIKNYDDENLKGVTFSLNGHLSVFQVAYLILNLSTY